MIGILSTILSLSLGLTAATQAPPQVEKPNRTQKPPAAKPAAQKPAPPQLVPPAAAGETVAITNARLMTGTGTTIDRGTVLIRGGKIVAVGANVQVPSGAKMVDAANRIVTPGFIESNTNLGIVEISLSAEGTAGHDGGTRRSWCRCGGRFPLDRDPAASRSAAGRR